MNELTEIIKELLEEYGSKKEYEDLQLQRENPEYILKAIENFYGKFSIKNFKHALKYRTIFTNTKSMMKELMIRSIEDDFIKEITSEEFINKKINDIISKNMTIGTKNPKEEIEEIKETFHEQLFISRKILEKKNKKITFSKGNSENNITGKISLSKGDLTHLKFSENSREYNLYWLSNGDILISKEDLF